MFTEEIYITAVSMCNEESELIGLLAETAQAELMKRLREGVSVQEIKPLFITAAAMIACSMFYAAKADGAKSWSAGKVSVTTEDISVQMRDRAEMLLAGYLDAGSGFEFMGVQG